MKSIPKIKVSADCDLVHTSYAFAGLISLANEGLIDLRISVPWSKWSKYRGRFTVLFNLREGHSKQSLKACVDLHDANTYFSMASLEDSDFYFKSNFNSEAVDQLPRKLRAKIWPLGPYYACRNNIDSYRSKRLLGSALSLLSKHGVAETFGSLDGLYRLKQGTIGRLKRYSGRLTFADYERQKEGEGEAKIYFNPGCWPERDKRTREINQLRAEVIRGLRKEFGPKFVGGFTRSPQAEQLYADCISNISYSHKEYVESVRSSLICIYTNGLDDCISWKLGEYLAAGKCIVAEPLQNQLAVPLVDGQDIFVFRTVEECLSHCRRLLSDSELSRQTERHSYEYYSQHVQPGRSMWRIVQCMLEGSKSNTTFHGADA